MRRWLVGWLLVHTLCVVCVGCGQAAANPDSSRRRLKNGRHVDGERRKAKDRHLELRFSSGGRGGPDEIDDGDVQEQKLKRALLETLKDGSEEVQSALLMEQAQLPLYERDFWSDWRHRHVLLWSATVPV